jgi:hypothetical protein
METIAALGVLAYLVALLIWTSRRWGAPRFYLRGRAALWVVAAILALIFHHVNNVSMKWRKKIAQTPTERRTTSPLLTFRSRGALRRVRLPGP